MARRGARSAILRAMQARQWIALAALLAGSGVVAGAFGAHALEERLTASGQLDTWETAVRYQVWHALALLAWALTAHAAGPGPDGQSRFLGGAKVGACFLFGALVFSGSLYGLALLPEGGLRSGLGPVTPLGGAVQIAGWILLTLGALRAPADAR